MQNATRDATSGGIRRPVPALAFSLLVLVLLAAAVFSMAVGAAGIPPSRLWAALGFGDAASDTVARDHLVLWSIRLPRVVMGMIIGALLAGAGAIMQGLFRNPLADPAMVGVSSAAAFAAAVALVVGDKYLFPTLGGLPFGFLPVAALGGALVSTLALYRLATRHGQTSVAVFLLAGLALAALANAGIGFLVFIADDRQLRDITFWLLGSLGGATWDKVTFLLPFLALTLGGAMWIARGLDLLAMGEAEAFYMGTGVETLKRTAILLISAAVGAGVAFCGIISFVGIIVPHLLRLAMGPGHRLLLPASMLLGAALLVGADSIARTMVAPAELPIGIVTAIVGAPFFLILLLRQRDLVSL